MDLAAISKLLLPFLTVFFLRTREESCMGSFSVVLTRVGMLPLRLYGVNPLFYVPNR